MEVNDQLHAPSVLHPRRKSILLADYEVVRSPEPVWTFRRIESCPYLECKNDSIVVHPVAQLIIHWAMQGFCKLATVSSNFKIIGQGLYLVRLKLLLYFQTSYVRKLTGIGVIFIRKILKISRKMDQINLPLLRKTEWEKTPSVMVKSLWYECRKKLRYLKKSCINFGHRQVKNFKWKVNFTFHLL